MHFTTAIFDMDGTLFDTECLAMDALQAVFEGHGVVVPRQTLETVIGWGGQEAREFLGRFAPVGVGMEDILKSAGAIINDHIERYGMPIKAGAVELLSHLKERGTAIGLATSANTGRAVENLSRAGISHYFHAVISGDQVEKGKPHPDIYLKALQMLCVDAADAIALEDSDHGIRAAFAAGLRVIHIPDVKRIDDETKACVHRQYATLLEFRDEIEGAVG